MPFLKLLFFVLLFLNVLAIAAGLGWLGGSTPRGEPERLTNQINPQLIRLETPLTAALPPAEPPPPEPETAPPEPTVALPPQPLPPQPSPTPSVAADPPPLLACMAITGLRTQAAGQLEQIARAAGPEVEVVRTVEEAGSGWWVRIPPAANREEADRRAMQMRQEGISDLFVVRDPGPDQHSISLGQFRTESAARQHLNDIRRHQITDAEVTTRTPSRYRLEITAPSALLATILGRMPDAAGESGREACRQ